MNLILKYDFHIFTASRRCRFLDICLQADSLDRCQKFCIVFAWLHHRSITDCLDCGCSAFIISCRSTSLLEDCELWVRCFRRCGSFALNFGAWSVTRTVRISLNLASAEMTINVGAFAGLNNLDSLLSFSLLEYYGVLAILRIAGRKTRWTMRVSYTAFTGCSLNKIIDSDDLDLWCRVVLLVGALGWLTGNIVLFKSEQFL